VAKPDQKLKNEILEAAADSFPNPREIDSWNQVLGKDVVTATVSYLKDHGLVEATGRVRMGVLDSFHDVTITSAGFDYLSEDGGLTAELGVVTVRIEAETIQALVTAQIEMADATRQEKNLLRQQLQALSKEGHQRLASQLIRLGLEAAPRSIQWLQTLIDP
jgi:hypothetical protein